MMKGWKTWTAAALAVIYGVGGLLLGLHDVDKMVEMLVYGMSLVGIGHKLDRAAL